VWLVIDQVQPEVAYFYLQDGKRGGMVVFEESDQVRMTAINEPLFAKLNAAIDIQPVLSLDDLLKNI
jgi:hypothetical protein